MVDAIAKKANSTARVFWQNDFMLPSMIIEYAFALV
jgi:hypothetical protein